ncbi:MAG: hypothetical protein SA339_00955 [Methanomassiliicoccus sp.]|nr:hypothetical protein [Methanomassiliicoccus sp.]
MHLLKLMLREEYRLHVSYSSSRMFLAMPVFVFVIALVTSLTMRNLAGNIDLRDMVTSLNAGVCLYGISVGALGFLGRTYVERRQGKYNYIVAMPALLPLSYRSTFLGMYIRDIAFYIALMLGPAISGLVVAGAVVGYSWGAVLSISATLVLSFLLGISLSFAVSVIGSRNRIALLVMVGAIMAVLIGFGVLHLYSMDAFLPSVGFQMALPPFGDDISRAASCLALSVSAFAGLSVLAILCVAETYDGEVKKKGPRANILPSYLRRFAFARSYRPYLAKESVDLLRSGTIGKISFTFIAPLTFLSFATWYINTGLNVPVGFNLVFYASMVGFFGVMLYSWLTNMDTVDYYETLPVSPTRIIRSKLMMFILLTTAISTAFVLTLSVINNETRLLWLALPVLYVTMVYMVVSMSYLTGLHPNSYLFNPQVLLRFALVSMLPETGLTILSFSVDRSPFIAGVAIVAVLGVLLVMTLVLYRRLDRRWSGTGF